MHHYKRQLERLQRELERRQWASAGALVEVTPLPYRLYELDEDGRRVYVEPDEGELELDAKMRRLIHGR